MFHPLDKTVFRCSFIYDKANISEPINKELLDYIRHYQKLIDEIDYTEGGIYAYDTTIFVTEEVTIVKPVYVVVVWGADWMNFIEDLLDFNTSFPDSKIIRESSYSHILKDENRVFDDIPGR